MNLEPVYREGKRQRHLLTEQLPWPETSEVLSGEAVGE